MQDTLASNCIDIWPDIIENVTFIECEDACTADEDMLYYGGVCTGYDFVYSSKLCTLFYGMDESRRQLSGFSFGQMCTKDMVDELRDGYECVKGGKFLHEMHRCVRGPSIHLLHRPNTVDHSQILQMCNWNMMSAKCNAVIIINAQGSDTTSTTTSAQYT